MHLARPSLAHWVLMLVLAFSPRGQTEKAIDELRLAILLHIHILLHNRDPLPQWMARIGFTAEIFREAIQ